VQMPVHCRCGSAVICRHGSTRGSTWIVVGPGHPRRPRPTRDPKELPVHTVRQRPLSRRPDDVLASDISDAPSAKQSEAVLQFLLQ